MNKRFFKGKSLKPTSWTEIDLIHAFAQAGGREGEAGPKKEDLRSSPPPPREGAPELGKERGSSESVHRFIDEEGTGKERNQCVNNRQMSLKQVGKAGWG